MNRVPSKSVSSTPYEIWRGKKPNLKYFKIWGCSAYVKRNFGHKLDTRADKYLFVGYPKDSIGYLFYHPTEQKVFVSRHATFMEKEFILERGSGRNIEINEVQQKQIDISQPNIHINKEELEHITPIHRSERVRHVPIRYGFIIENNEAHIIKNDEPLTYTKVVMSRDSDKWLEAMKSEMDSMYSNQL